jgi:hypothetical protein
MVELDNALRITNFYHIQQQASRMYPDQEPILCLSLQSAGHLPCGPLLVSCVAEPLQHLVTVSEVRQKAFTEHVSKVLQAILHFPLFETTINDMTVGGVIRFRSLG